MRVTNFKDADKFTAVEHKVLGTIYVPELSIFEIENYNVTLHAHCTKVAEKVLEDVKERSSNEPISADFVFSQEKVPFWKNSELPKSSYDEQLITRATLCYSQMIQTMFLCDSEGECICPFVEGFGEISRKRMKLYSDLARDLDAFRLIEPALIGDLSNSKEGENSPNVEAGSLKKKKNTTR